VAAKDFTAIEAETETPATTKIVSISRRENARKDADGNFLDEVKFRFKDDAAVANFYLVKLKSPFILGTTIGYQGIYCIRSNDKDIDRNGSSDPDDFDNCIDQEFLMTDKNFNGSTKEIILFIQHYDLEPVSDQANNKYYPLVEFNSITADDYKYKKSYAAYQEARDNPFAEPVLIYTNVKNGYGIFSTYGVNQEFIR
jgi:hypothetical protein